MPQYRRVLDVYQGYNFKKDKQTPVGFITKMKIGTIDLKVDQTCKDPMNPTSELKVVAVCSDVLWELGVTDAQYFTNQVSVFNRQAIAALVINDLTNIEVLFQFTVYDYDPLEKKYFKAFHSNDTDMKGLLEKKGEDVNLTIADDTSTEVQSPENYTMNVGIKPQALAQALTVATGVTKNLVKAWGLTVAAS